MNFTFSKQTQAPVWGCCLQQSCNVIAQYHLLMHCYFKETSVPHTMTILWLSVLPCQEKFFFSSPLPAYLQEEEMMASLLHFVFPALPRVRVPRKGMTLALFILWSCKIISCSLVQGARQSCWDTRPISDWQLLQVALAHTWSSERWVASRH